MTRLLLIRTKHDPKPIPVREFDWDAWIDGREEDFTAHGPTQTAAVEELVEKIESHRFRDALRRSVEVA
jgi:hypothetical protein